jgi:hypothetical protein
LSQTVYLVTNLSAVGDGADADLLFFRQNHTRV